VNRNKNRILYSVIPKETGNLLSVSVDPKNSDSLKNFYETLEKNSSKELEGEIIHGSSYSSLRVFLEGEIRKYEDIIYPFVDSIKNKNGHESRRHFI
jgi:hypothetical protein